MSSIYRKGRDGYYYYQTYIFDAKTGKKNKKVYHSLRTKIKSEALERKREYDDKYEKSTKTISKYIKYYKIFIPVTILFYIFFEVSSLNNVSKSQDVVEVVGDDKSNSEELNEDMEIEKTLNKTIKVESKTHDSLANNYYKVDSSVEKREIKIPSYKLHRIEKVSGAFNQGKIFVTIDEKIERPLIHHLCKELKDKHNNFRNIIICVYSANKEGTLLAKGEIDYIDNEKQKKSWLALYTYNEVEGEYIDFRPSSYLGNF